MSNSNDFFMKIAILLIIFQVIIGFITHLIPIKSQFLGHFQIRYSEKINLYLTIFLVLSSVLIAFNFPKAKTLLNILGAFFGTGIVTTFPGMMITSYWR